MEVVVTTGAIGRAKLQSNHHHQKPTSSFYRPDALPVTQPTVSKNLRGKYHISWTCLPQAHLRVFQLFLWPLIAPGYIGDGCHTSHQPSNASTPANFHAQKSDFVHGLCWVVPTTVEYHPEKDAFSIRPTLKSAAKSLSNWRDFTVYFHQPVSD